MTAGVNGYATKKKREEIQMPSRSLTPSNDPQPLILGRHPMLWLMIVIAIAASIAAALSK